MCFRFTVRSFLFTVTLTAILLSVLCTIRYCCRPFSVPALVVALGGVTFWMVLLLPVWAPFAFADDETPRHQRYRALWALIPALWYCMLVILFHLIGPGAVSKTVGFFGTCAAFVSLCWAAKGGWSVLCVPLGFALITGTLWLIMC